jgi:MoaA/NifB/PqqE/SkfB family radical SAM enzyme
MKNSHLNLRYTTLCNYNCSFCVRHSEITPKTLNKSDYLSKLSDLLDIEQFDSVSISGGEPLLEYALFTSVVDLLKIKQPMIKLSINTNGSLINKQFAAYVNYNDVHVDISFHSLNNEKSVRDAVITGKNLSLIADIISINKKSIKKVIKPNEQFSNDILDLKRIFNCPISLSLFQDSDNKTKIITNMVLSKKTNFDATALVNIETELKKLTNQNCIDVNIGYTSPTCTFTCKEFLPDGSLYNTCEPVKTINDVYGWYGCIGLFNITGPEGFFHLVDICNRYKQGLL